MSDGNIQTERRRKRVQRMKRYIILTFVTLNVAPLVLCLILCAKIVDLEDGLEGLTAQVKELSEDAAVLRGIVAELTLEMQSAGQGSAINSNSEADSKFFGYAGEEKDEIQDPTGNGDGETQEQEPEITAAHKVYLTFDDGPSIYTQDILDILDRYDVKATFFVLGKTSDSAKESLKRIVEDGHTLGMHSYSHVYTDIYASKEAFAEDFTKLREYLYEVTGVNSSVYRFPGGSSNTVSKIPMRDFAEYLDEQNVVFFDWNVASGDATSIQLSVEEIVKNSTENITRYGTSVILLHDTAKKRSTVEALPIIIENILAMEDTVILPITEDTKPVQHIHWRTDNEEAADKREDGGLE